jgi:hypothetical protein
LLASPRVDRVVVHLGLDQVHLGFGVDVVVDLLRGRGSLGCRVGDEVHGVVLVVGRGRNVVDRFRAQHLDHLGRGRTAGGGRVQDDRVHLKIDEQLSARAKYLEDPGSFLAHPLVSRELRYHQHAADEAAKLLERRRSAQAMNSGWRR